MSARAGWTRVAFGDVVSLVRERSSDPEGDGLERYVGLEHLDPGDLRIRRWGKVSDGTTFTNVFRAGQVLFGKRRAYQRKVAVADFDGVCSGDIYVFEPKGDGLLPELLPFICQTDRFFEHAVGTSAGSLSPRTNWASLAEFDFPLPPLDEQRRVARALREASGLRERLDALTLAVSLTGQALINEAIRGVPEGSLVAVSELLIEGPRNGISPPVNSDGQGLRTVSISAVAHGVFDPTGCVKHALVAREVVAPFFVSSGDVFVVRGNGNRQLCAVAGLNELEHEDLFFPDLLIRLRFDPVRILPEFAVAQWNLPGVHGRLLARAKSSNGIWKVNGQDIRAHRLAVPPTAEQERFASALRQVRREAAGVLHRSRSAAAFQAQLVREALNQ